MTRTYTFVFDSDPEGGFVVTCPALPGLVTHGATLDEAKAMTKDAMESLQQAAMTAPTQASGPIPTAVLVESSEPAKPTNKPAAK